MVCWTADCRRRTSRACARHLEDCEPCRETLEALATERNGRFPGAPDVARPGPTEPALLAAVAALEKLAAADDSGTEEVEDAAADLSFLAPADKPGLLGRLGEYEVLEVIGRGGMSVVFKAFDPTLHRVAAIKVLAPQMAGSAVARRRSCARAAQPPPSCMITSSRFTTSMRKTACPTW